MKLGYNLLKLFIKNNINSLGTSTNQHLLHFMGANAFVPTETFTLFSLLDVHIMHSMVTYPCPEKELRGC